jgi:DNA-binding NarL/FixJ family response regulator
MVGELDIEQGQLADAATHLELALRLADDCAAPFERAQTLLALADLHDARGEPDSAGRQRDAAQAICAELGATRVLARRAVPTKRARPEPYPAGLTAREVEVLRLLAQGESNREIASALFLSVRTVERHLSNAYGKIAARNRADATAYAVRRLL